jgi:Transferrin
VQWKLAPVICRLCCSSPDFFVCTRMECMCIVMRDVWFIGSYVVVKQDFELLCTDGTRAPVTSAASCNWGTVASHTVMTSMVRRPELRAAYKTLLLMLSIDFGQGGVSTDLFQLFDSTSYGRQNLMFTDETVMLKDTSKVAGGTRDSYYAWAGESVISLSS